MIFKKTFLICILFSLSAVASEQPANVVIDVKPAEAPAATPVVPETPKKEAPKAQVQETTPQQTLNEQLVCTLMLNSPEKSEFPPQAQFKEMLAQGPRAKAFTDMSQKIEAVAKAKQAKKDTDPKSTQNPKKLDEEQKPDLRKWYEKRPQQIVVALFTSAILAVVIQYIKIKTAKKEEIQD